MSYPTTPGIYYGSYSKPVYLPGGVAVRLTNFTFTGSAYVHPTVPGEFGAAVTGGNHLTVGNDGTIIQSLGTQYAGIILHGGTLANEAAGRVVGGVIASAYPITVINAGYIGAPGRYGIEINYGNSLSGGMITNTGVISGKTAVGTLQGAGDYVEVTNYGTIIGTNRGLFNQHLTNKVGGLVEATGSAGVAVVAQQLTNAGTILATGSSGIAVAIGVVASFPNAGGLIEATGPQGIGLGKFEHYSIFTFTNTNPVLASGSGGSGAYISGGSGKFLGGSEFSSTQMINASTLTGSGSGGAGVRLNGAATITNTASGLINGYNGIYDAGTVSVTVVNQGTIAGTGSSGYGVRFGSGNDLLELDPSGKVTGRLNGGVGTSTLELLVGPSFYIGSIGGLGSTVTNFKQIQVDAGAQWALTGTNIVAAAVEVLDTGILTTTATLTNNGEIDASTGTLIVGGPLRGSGTIALSNNGLVELVGGAQAGGAIAFRDATDTLVLADPLGVALTVQNFAAGDTLDLPNVKYSTGPVTGSYTGGDLLVMQGGGTVADLPATGIAPGAKLHAHADTGGGTDLILVPCFRAGTRIHTARGEVPVEALAPGDLVHTQFSGAAPVQWIGHRRVDCRGHPDPRKVWPVRVRTDAFGDGRPHRDLWLSPDHAIFVGEVLIPVKLLINDTTIVQEPVDEVTYYHLELPRHEVLLAEGLPCESFLDTGGRKNFENGGGAVALYPDFASLTWEAGGCAPLIVTGPQLDAARQIIVEAGARTGRRADCRVAIKAWQQENGHDRISMPRDRHRNRRPLPQHRTG